MSDALVYECKSVVLREALDSGMPGPEHFDIVTTTVDASALPEGAILVQAHFISADPYLRGTIKSTGYNKASTPSQENLNTFLNCMYYIARNAAVWVYFW